jgi:hypothetical protein
MFVVALLASAFLAFPAGAAASPSSLGAFWQFNEPSGTSVLDSSSYHNNGTLSGAQRIAGRFGGALRFASDTDSVTIPDAASLRPSSMTVEAWVRASASPGNYKHIISRGATACIAASYGLYTGANGGLAFYVADGTSFSVSPDAGTGVWNGAWHHVAGEYDATAGVVRLFVDGVQVGSGTPSSIVVNYATPNSTNVMLGLYGGPCVQPLAYRGDLDEARIWQRALAAGELAASAKMGDPATTNLAEADNNGDPLVFTSTFTTEEYLVVSLESSSGQDQIAGVRIVGLPVLGASCGNFLSSKCRITLSNGGRTAALGIDRGLLSGSRVYLRVTLVSGQTFDVVATIE